MSEMGKSLTLLILVAVMATIIENIYAVHDCDAEEKFFQLFGDEIYLGSDKPPRIERQLFLAFLGVFDENYLVRWAASSYKTHRTSIIVKSTKNSSEVREPKLNVQGMHFREKGYVYIYRNPQNRKQVFLLSRKDGDLYSKVEDLIIENKL